MPASNKDYAYLLKLQAGIDDDLIMLMSSCRFGERTIIIKKALRLYIQNQVSTADLLEELLFIQDLIREISVVRPAEEILEQPAIEVSDELHTALMEFGL